MEIQEEGGGTGGQPGPIIGKNILWGQQSEP